MYIYQLMSVINDSKNVSNIQLHDILLCVILYYVFWTGGHYVQINDLS